jgi:pyrrolidone-carboxylate peptidase
MPTGQRHPPPIPGDGPPACLRSVPVEPVLQAWAEAGISGYGSQTASSYLCSLAYYLADRTAAELGSACMADCLLTACRLAGDETGMASRAPSHGTPKEST